MQSSPEDQEGTQGKASHSDENVATSALGLDGSSDDLESDQFQRLRNELRPWAQSAQAASSSTNTRPSPRTKRGLKIVLSDDADATPDEENDAGSEDDTMLDPDNTERLYYREPATGMQREVWRPGDGDGRWSDDYFEKPGPKAPLAKRWRFFQSSPATPYTARSIEPPKYVVLDDLAAYEVLKADLPKTQLSHYWSYDFGGPGKIRTRRPNRGRAAIRDDELPIDNKDRYQSSAVGQKGASYYYKGEPDPTWKPILYEGVTEALKVVLPIDREPPEDRECLKDKMPPVSDKPKQHNQYTARQDLVRNGAPSSSTRKNRARINTYLRRSPSPPRAGTRANLYSGLGAQRHQRYQPAMATPTRGQNESLWLPQEDDDDEADEALDDTNLLGAASTSLDSPKRAASPRLETPRKKIVQEMGYIERLAAGIPYEHPTPRVAGSPAADRARIDELERELTESREMVRQRDEEVRELKAELEAMKARKDGGE